MKKIFTTIFLFLFISFSFAQSYEQQLSNAAEFMSKKEFCKAYEIFKPLLIKDNPGTNYDYYYYYASLSAVNCKKNDDALEWLNIAVEKGLGIKDGEIDLIKNDENFKELKSTAKWTSIIKTMQNKFAAKKLFEEEKSKEWVSSITKNSIQQKKSKFNYANSGIALYYSKVENINVPYLVYVPKNYNASKETKAIIYLHGGINSYENFIFDQPEIAQEPIFKVADKFNTIVIYPFGRKDFGWINQKKAFENIYTILKQVQLTYNIDEKNIYLGGMSNGGTASFWFASQRPSVFTGFYAISAFPKLEIGKINFDFDKPFYEIHTKDDSVFNFDDVEKIYESNKSKNWHFEAIENGDHGLIYQENGTEVLENLLNKLIESKNDK